MKSIETAFAATNREQLTLAELVALGVTKRALDSAVAAAKLRKGVMGYWLPRAADPGALFVMRGAMTSQADDNDDDN